MITFKFRDGNSRRTARARRTRLQLEALEPRLNMALTVPAYSSVPGANHTIYLDFDGNTTTGTSWNSSYGVDPIVSPAYSTDTDAANFSASELATIERVWRRVSEDFAPFQVNVTTVEPTLEDLRNTGSGDTKWGVRVVITKDVAFNCGCGGIAYINSFTWNSDTPAFVFNTSEIGVSEAVSHEVGHTLGLAHDGTATTSYYQGHGLGTDTAYWGPLMGASYYVDVSQWDNGVYYGTNNGSSSANYNRGPDDLGIITTYNGFGYKTDDHGNSTLTASPLTISGTSVSASGLVTTRTDSDYFQFTTGAGAITLNVNSASLGANLDIEASLFDSAGTLIASSNPLMSLNATISATVPAGQYFLKIDGVGAGDPTVSAPTGYTDYASIGQYSIAGTIVGVAGDALSIGATDAVKSEGNSGATLFTFTVNRSGDTTGTSSVSYSVTGTGTNKASGSDFANGFPTNMTVNFAAGVSAVNITLNVIADSKKEANEQFKVTLASAVGATVATSSATGVIVNDDTTGRGQASSNSADGDGEDALIAVADPLWMFIPPSALSAEQLSVPVVSWVDGVRHLGDFGHMHESATFAADADEAIWAPGWDALVTWTPLTTIANEVMLPTLRPVLAGATTGDVDAESDWSTHYSVVSSGGESDNEAVDDSLALDRLQVARRSTNLDAIDTVWSDWSDA